MRIDIITIFPEMFSGAFSHSLLKRAQQDDIVSITVHNLRDWCHDKHRQIDDSPYGGGPGMVFKPEPLHAAIASLKTENSLVVLTCPRGVPFSQAAASGLSAYKHLILIAAHYEGIDERIVSCDVDMSISIGDFVLCGGELPSMVICEAVVRLLPGVVGNVESIRQDSFQGGLLDYPHYTRPANFLGQNVPPVLLSGDHENIARWRTQQSIVRTFQGRPDLLGNVALSDEQRTLFTDYFKHESNEGVSND